MLQDRAKRAVARLPLLTEVPMSVCVSHPQRSGKDIPKPSWAWQAPPPSKIEHSVLLLHHCSCCRPCSGPLIILRIYFLFPESGLYTPVWCSIPVLITGSHSQTILPFQTSGARQTQTTLVLRTRLSLFLFCPIAHHSTYTLYLFFCGTWIFWNQREMHLISLGPGW